MQALSNLAFILQAADKPREALALQRELLEVRRRVAGARHPTTNSAAGNLAVTLMALHQFSEAEQLLRDVLQSRRNDLPAGDHTTLLTMTDLARTLEAQGKFADAEALAREAVSIIRAAKNDRAGDLSKCLMMQGNLLSSMGRGPEAVPLLRESLALARRTLPHDSPLIGIIETALGSSLGRAGQLSEAEVLLLSGTLAVLNNRLSAANDRRAVIERVIALYQAQGDAAKAKPWRLKQLDAEFPADPFAR